MKQVYLYLHFFKQFNQLKITSKFILTTQKHHYGVGKVYISHATPSQVWE